MARTRGHPSEEPSIPATARPAYDAIVGLTDAFCLAHLNESTRSRAGIWPGHWPASDRHRCPAASPRSGPAGSSARSAGSTSSTSAAAQPHLKLTAIDKAFGVAESTGQGKSKAIRTMMKIRQFDPRWTLPSRMDENPRAWMIDINDFVVDARHLQREFQEEAMRKGLIPYIPGERADVPVEE